MDIVKNLVAVSGTLHLQLLVVLVLADVVSGLLSAFVNGKFEADKLLKFIGTNIVPYVGGWIVLSLFNSVVPADVQPEWDVFYNGAFLFFLRGLTKSTWENIAEVVPGLGSYPVDKVVGSLFGLVKNTVKNIAGKPA